MFVTRGSCAWSPRRPRSARRPPRAARSRTSALRRMGQRRSCFFSETGHDPGFGFSWQPLVLHPQIAHHCTEVLLDRGPLHQGPIRWRRLAAQTKPLRRSHGTRCLSRLSYRRIPIKICLHAWMLLLLRSHCKFTLAIARLFKP